MQVIEPLQIWLSFFDHLIVNEKLRKSRKMNNASHFGFGNMAALIPASPNMVS